jgi:spore germination protein KB
MNKEVSIRQMMYMYIFITLSSILREIPFALAREADRSGYLSPLWSTAALIPLAGVILLLIKAYPGLNIYEIMVHLTGKFLAKVFILAYLLWFMLILAARVNIYSLSLQFTLMPKTRSDFFMAVMIIMVFYALAKGIKTVFRFSEFILGPIVLLIAVLFVCAFTRLRADYLFPVSIAKLPSSIMASKSVIASGGIIIIALFFADKYGISVTKQQKRRLLYAILFFVLLTFVVTLFTFGVTGALSAASFPFPFYITVKSISFFNVFERFEVLVALICMLSDFLSICVLGVLILRCIGWLFNAKQELIFAVPVTMIIFYLTYFISSTQFEYDYIYNTLMLNLSLIFQYALPFFLALLSLGSGRRLKKPY